MLGRASATTVESSISRKRPVQVPASVHHWRDMPRRLCGGQVALGVDAPALGDSGQLAVERPAVGALLALVSRAGALQRHAAGVVADGADRGDVLVAEPLL